MNRRDALKTAVSGLLATFINAAPRRTIDLQSFCAKTPSRRYNLTSPYHLADHTYATDTAICVRVKPMTADTATHDGVIPPFDKLSWDHDNLRHWMPAKRAVAIPAAESDCPRCFGFGGLGGMGNECDRCQGCGSVFASTFGDGSIDCPDCAGRGFRFNGPTCPDCDGRAIGVFPTIVSVNGVYYDAGQYNKVIGLNSEYVQADWCSQTSKPPLSPVKLLKFRFDGGDGMLMPLNTSNSEWRIMEASNK